MTTLWFLIAFSVGAMAGYALITMGRRRGEKYLAACEYWVFLPGTAMPSQDEVMTRMVRDNPYTKRGQSPIGPAEGLVFSDVRLHIALVLRTKNPHAFRPDLFQGDVSLTAEQLTDLSEANAFVKLRYISEEPLKNRQHLQFLLHAADAYAELGGSRLVFDQTARRVLSRPQISEWLKTHFDATVPSLHSQIRWVDTPGASRAETQGLRKVGHPEIATAPVSTDQRILVAAIMEAVVERVWNEPTLPERLEVSAFDDQFQLQILPRRNEPSLARIHRVQSL